MKNRWCLNRPRESLPDDTDLIDFFVDEITRFRSTYSSYSIEQPVRSENLNEVSFHFSYEKRLPGKNKLLQVERKTLKVSVRKISSEEVAIDIRQQSSSDATEALELLRQIAGDSEDGAFSLVHVNLLALPPKNSVDFFHQLMSNSLQSIC
jgi:hypothetical protein